MMFRVKVIVSRDGFALVTALIAFAVLSSAATAIMIGTRTAARTASSEVRILSARYLADAGLMRLVASAEDPTDELLQQLRSTRQPVRWAYAGGIIALSMIPESGKIDVNTGDPELLRRALRIAVQDDRRAEEIARSVFQSRERKQLYTTPLALLPPRERLLPVASRIRSMFTVMTRCKGIDPGSASDDVLRSLPGMTDRQIEVLRGVQRGVASFEGTWEHSSNAGLFEPELPIYTLLAVAYAPDGTVARRQATIAVDPHSRRSAVVVWDDLAEPLEIPGGTS